jgi:hypothetical protein
MAKPTKTAHARGGQIKPTPFTGDLKEAILAGLNARPGGVLGFLDKVALENPRLAGRGRVGTRIISRRRAWPALLPRARRNVTNEAAIPPPTVENGLPTAFQRPSNPPSNPGSNPLPTPFPTPFHPTPHTPQALEAAFSGAFGPLGCSPRRGKTAGVGRVGVWRGGVRLSISVYRPFRLAAP